MVTVRTMLLLVVLPLAPLGVPEATEGKPSLWAVYARLAEQAHASGKREFLPVHPGHDNSGFRLKHSVMPKSPKCTALSKDGIAEVTLVPEFRLRRFWIAHAVHAPVFQDEDSLPRLAASPRP